MPTSSTFTGGYQFTDTTRGNFTLAYTQARQIDSFPAVLAPTAGALPTGGLNRSPPPSTSGRRRGFRDKSVLQPSGAATSPFPTSSTTRPPSSSSGYALDKDTSLRLDYIFDHRKNNDWTWNGTLASGPTSTDGTTLFQRPEDKAGTFGVSVSYTFR